MVQTLQRSLRWLWLVLLVLGAEARAQQSEDPVVEPEATDDSADAAADLDAWFGENIVGPFFTVLFFDLVFWDDTLAPGEGVGQVVGDERITEFRNGTYVYQREHLVPADTPKVLRDGDQEELPSGVRLVVLDAEQGRVRVAGGPIPAGDWAVTPLAAWTREPLQLDEPKWVQVLVGEDGLDAQRTTAALEVGARSWQITGGGETTLELGDGVATVVVGPGTKRDLVVIGGLAPVPLLADRTGEAIIGTQAVLTTGLPAEVGDTIVVDGETAKVEAVEESGLRVLDDAQRIDEELLSNPEQIQLPFIVAWLVLGAVFFTLRMQFVNLRAFPHAIAVTMGRYDDPEEDGEISHFQALASALSATVGLGNIAGVAVAVGTGGPGAIFWMVTAGFLGMSSKFTECTLGQMYRHIDDKGSVSGGPFRYLASGLSDLGWPRLGRVLATVFAIMCIGGSFGGGNMFQSNQAVAQLTGVFPQLAGNELPMGIVLALLVGLVIIGGIKRIGAAAGIIVPVMCGIYVLAGLWILLAHAADIPAAFTTILSEAFSPTAMGGGFIGVLVVGFQRAAFSNEAGVGSASIAHSAATTQEPVREGIVALLEPFIDTIIVCSMTGLVVVITGAYQSGESDGVRMTSEAFGSVISWFPYLLSLAVLLFAFSTMISWSYYGERSWTFLFGPGSALVYKLLFLVMAVLGAVLQLGSVIDFSDAMILGMAFPNILGAFMLSGRVKEALDDYWQRHKSGAFTRTG